MMSASVGALSGGGVQNAVSRSAASVPSGRVPGDQWPAAATRENDRLLSGFPAANTLPPANRMSSGVTFSWDAASFASLSRRRVAAIWAVPATAPANRLE